MISEPQIEQIKLIFPLFLRFLRDIKNLPLISQSLVGDNIHLQGADE